jgi:hypothetical protein
MLCHNVFLLPGATGSRLVAATHRSENYFRGVALGTAGMCCH